MSVTRPTLRFPLLDAAVVVVDEPPPEDDEELDPPHPAATVTSTVAATSVTTARFICANLPRRPPLKRRGAGSRPPLARLRRDGCYLTVVGILILPAAIRFS